MKSAVYVRSQGRLDLQERNVPEPAEGQVLIKVHRCGICGSDFAMTSGSPFDYPDGFPLGHEYAGEVVKVGPGCETLAPGDRVTAVPLSSCGQCGACLADTPIHCPELKMLAGGFAEYTVADERMAFKLPESLTYEDGALVEPMAASLRGVRKLEIDSTTTIAVLGAGAIAASAIFWARKSGAARIVAIARSRKGESLVLRVGADDFLVTGDALSERVAEALGATPDIVIEGVGVPGMLQQAIEMVRPGGTVLSLGGCNVADGIIPALAMAKEVSLLFSVAYGVQNFRHTIDTLAADPTALRSLISETISLDELPQRFEEMRQGSHGGKVMVDPA